MKYYQDPIYRALNKEKPDKQKTLAAAYAEMERAPQKTSRFKLSRRQIAAAACVVVLIAVIVPLALMLNNRGGVYLDKSSGNISPAPATPTNDDATKGEYYIYFDLEQSYSYTPGDSDKEESETVGEGILLSVYTVNNQGKQETASVYLYNGAPPANAIYDVTIPNLGVVGVLTIETVENESRYEMYFIYRGDGYRVLIVCADASRFEYFLSKLH